MPEDSAERWVALNHTLSLAFQSWRLLVQDDAVKHRQLGKLLDAIFEARDDLTEAMDADDTDVEKGIIRHSERLLLDVAALVAPTSGA